jgi:hypothetical protein
MLSPERRGAARAWLATAIIAAGAAFPAEPARVRVNGVPFALQMRVLAGEPAALAQRLDGRWGQRLASPGAKVADDSRQPSTPASRQVLGRQRGPFHETLTLLPGPRAGTSYAVVAVQDLRRRPASLPSAPLPLPAGARILNVVQFGDAPGASALFSAGTVEAPPRVIARLVQAARAHGWQVAGIAPPAGVAGAAFWARQGTRELSVVATPAGAGARLQLLQVAGQPERPW